MTILERIHRAVRDTAAAHRFMWETLERLAPDPTPELHWEPTTSGWRLYGHIAPPCDVRRHG